MTPIRPSTIRTGTREDAGGIARVQVLGWQWAYRGLMPQEVLDTMSVSERTTRWQHILSAEGSHSMIVSEIEGSIVGFCSYGPSRDTDAREHTGEISALYLAEACVGRGHGRGLFQAAVEAFRRDGFASYSVWVLNTNRRGREFYERMGMRLDGAEKAEPVRGITLNELRYVAALSPTSGPGFQICPSCGGERVCWLCKGSGMTSNGVMCNECLGRKRCIGCDGGGVVPLLT